MTSLYEINPPDLINFDHDSLLVELIDRIKQHPQWSENYNGLLHHDSLSMVLSIYSFLFGKNAESFNRTQRENFYVSANTDEAKAYILREKNIEFKQNTESVATFKGILVNKTISGHFVIPKFTTLLVKGLNSQNIKYEVIKKVDGEYDYFNDIEFDATQDLNSFTLDLYAGETFKHFHELNVKKENFIIEVPYSPVIQDSIQVYYYVNGTYTKLYEDKLDNQERVVTDVFPNGTPKYIVKYSFDNKPIIVFGTQNFGGTFNNTHSAGKVVVFGRIGGGVASQIPEGSVDTTIEFMHDGDSYSIRFINLTKGVGGADAEALDEVIRFAPLNVGRGKHVIDKYDSSSKLRNYLSKLKIDNPKYDRETFNDVPLLHNFYYMVPNRDFSLFKFPTLLTSDTLSSYNSKFVSQISKFCNVQGNHDAKVVDEIKDRNTNGNTSFYTTANWKNIMSSSLKAKAYNANGELVDSIEFIDNYPLTKIVNNKYANERTEVYSKAFDTIKILGSGSRINNTLKLYIDDHDFMFVLGLANFNNGIDAFSLAAMLNGKIRALIQTSCQSISELMTAYATNHVFVSAVDSKLKFTSPKTGKRSRIKFVGEVGTASYNLLEDFSLLPKSYRPSRTKIVFNYENSFYDYTKNEVYCDINQDEINQIENYTVAPVQSFSSVDGPTIELELIDKLFDYKYDFLSGSNMTVEILEGEIKKDEIQFKGLTPFAQSIAGQQTGLYTGSVVKSASDCKIDVANAKIIIKSKDGIENFPYKAGYADELGEISKVMLYRIVDEENSTLIQSWNYEVSWSQVKNSPNGTTIYIPVYVNNKLVVDNNYRLDIFTKKGIAAEIIGESITFTAITATVTNGEGDNSKIQSEINVAKYDRELNQFVINCVDAIQDTSGDPVYFPAFLTFNKIRVTFKKKTYDSITLDYQSDPYHPENEALELMSKINSKETRLLSLENVSKDVDIIPVGFQVNVTVKSGFSKNNAKNFVYSQIMTNFGYKNFNDEHVIDSMISTNSINSIIMPFSSYYGITNVSIDTSSIDYVDLDNSSKKFYFVLGETLLNLLNAVETQNNNVYGLVDFYKIKVNVI